MNGSIMALASPDKSAEAQHKSKSPAEIILPSTKILCIFRRPSSISPGGCGFAGAALGPGAAGAGALAGAAGWAGAASLGELPALLSIWRSGAWTRSEED